MKYTMRLCCLHSGISKFTGALCTCYSATRPLQLIIFVVVRSAALHAVHDAFTMTLGPFLRSRNPTQAGELVRNIN